MLGERARERASERAQQQQHQHQQQQHRVAGAERERQQRTPDTPAFVRALPPPNSSRSICRSTVTSRRPAPRELTNRALLGLARARGLLVVAVFGALESRLRCELLISCCRRPRHLLLGAWAESAGVARSLLTEWFGVLVQHCTVCTSTTVSNHLAPAEFGRGLV